jgi:tetratricopeptide (TPR) repeat protein
MRIRPKTARRLTQLSIVLLLVGVCAFGLYRFDQYRKNQRILAAGREGLEAYHRGDYPVALEKLSRYVARHKDNYESLFAYAVSRARVEDPGGKHIREGILLFGQLVEQNPGDLAAKHELLDLYTKAGYVTETLQLADRVLESRPDDVRALRAKMLAMVRQPDDAGALKLALRLCEVEPLNLKFQLEAIALQARASTPPEEVIRRIETAAASYPDDPRFDVLLGVAYSYDEQNERALSQFRKAATKPAPDAEFVRQLAGVFDQLQLFEDTQTMLERSAARTDDVQVHRVLIRRLWQNGRFDEVIRRLETLAPDPVTADPELQALRAISQFQLGRREEGQQSIDSLSKRPDDARAVAWAEALACRFAAGPVEPRDAIRIYSNALARDRDNPIIRSMLAEAYLKVSETDLAVAQLRQAAEAAPSWAGPHLLIARSLLAEGNVAGAYEAAQAGWRRAPNSPAAAVTLATCWAASVQQNPDQDEQRKLRDFVSAIQKASRLEPETLPILVWLDCVAGDTESAAGQIDAALKHPLPPATLVRLSALSREFKLQRESQILAALPSTGDAPSLLARALELAKDGREAEGRQLLEQLVTRSPEAASRLALARYLEERGDTGAAEAWIKLGDENPDDIDVQTAILRRARSVRDNRPFLARTIERIRKLTGDEGLLWQQERARLLVEAEPSSSEFAEGVSLLTRMVAATPGAIEPRVMLAGALIRSGNTMSGIEHLRSAVDADPHNQPMTLELARLLRETGNLPLSRQYVERVASSDVVTPEALPLLGALLWEQGDGGRAVRLLQEAQARARLDIAGQMMLIELLRLSGKSAEAVPLAETLLRSRPSDPVVLGAVADLFVSIRDDNRVEQVLEQLKSASIPVADRERVLARISEAKGNLGSALEHFRKAVEADPSRVGAWLRLAEFQVRKEDLDGARSTLNEARSRVGHHASLAALERNLEGVVAAQGTGNLQPLIDALSSESENSPRLQLLRALQESASEKSTPEQAAARFRKLAEAFPTYVPVRMELARAYLSAGQKAEAEDQARELLERFPASGEAARAATGVFLAVGKWESAAKSAEAWARMSPQDRLAAEMALAEALLLGNRTKEAWDVLSPHLDQPGGRESLPLIRLGARCLIASGKPQDASELFQEKLNDPAWRAEFLDLAGGMVEPAAEARRWIERAASQSDRGSAREQLRLAATLQQLAARTGETTDLREALTILQRIREEPEVQEEVTFALGQVYSRTGELEQAEKAYRTFMVRFPGSRWAPSAQNDLAYLLLLRGDDGKESIELAQAACAAAPGEAAFFDTLGRAQARVGAHSDAIRAFREALKLNPNDLEALVGLAWSVHASGDRAEATRLLKQIQSLQASSPPLPEPVKKELQSLKAALAQSTD